MPITGPTSYVPTTEAFLVHWAEVNAALPSGQPLLLPNLSNSPTVISTRAAFVTARTALMTQRDELEILDLNLSFARATLDLARQTLHAWMNLFNDRVRGELPESAYQRSLADVPGVESGLEAFTKPMKRTRALWEKINDDIPSGATVPLVLQDGTTLAEFTTALSGLTAAFDAVVANETVAAIGIEKRNDLQVPLYEAMKAYRRAVPGRLMPTDALVDSLPGLTAEGGRTPDPVSLSAEWDAVAQNAKLTMSASTDPELREYEVRYCVGPNYDVDRDHVAGSVAPGGPLIFHTTKGVATPAAVGSYRVYVILNSGHEAGSNTTVVARPG